MILEHKAAVIARVNEDPVLATCGHEGLVLPDEDGNRPQRYWTVFTDSGVRYSDRLGGLPTSATLHYTFHCVGQNPEQAQRLAERLVGQLAGFQLVVDGYAPFRLRHASSEPTQMDATERPPIHFTVDRFDLSTQPA